MELGDAKVVEEKFLGAHHVEDGEGGEAKAVGFAGGGVGRRGAGGAGAAAGDVGADDEEAAGVDGLAGADKVVPPAGFFVGGGVPTGGVVVAGEGVADEDGVVAGGVKGAVGLVAEGEAVELLAVFEGEGTGENVVLGRDEADVVRRQVTRGGRGGGRGLGFVGHAGDGECRVKAVRGKDRAGL